MKYALKAVMVLGDEAAGQGRPLRIEDIAQQSGAPKRFLEHIMLDIKKSGLVASTRGRSGGYVLIKDPAGISIPSLLRLIDGPISPLPCLSRVAYRICDDCTDEATCRIRRAFSDAYYGYLLMFEGMTLADLMKGETRGEMSSEAIPSA
ncbi:transcriptional regulator, BadM/Rrf2 family [Loktanella atrilutea]|uniref:Transcriptional regulator, BadM/Rrf2 family n=2 Tax=Loktanella atrilutea TaxID=366533 RepID=A0A1M5CAF4_LOKAT|nr:transcriptional regulator, BadM/Rrf2 family [Loktanella atrilutea]